VYFAVLAGFRLLLRITHPDTEVHLRRFVLLPVHQPCACHVWQRWSSSQHILGIYFYV